MDIKSCVPADKFDLNALARARSVGFPELNPVLPELLIWLQDPNWPLAQDCALLLSKAGLELVPHLSAIFASDDNLWKWTILATLCPLLNFEVISALKLDLERLCLAPTHGERLEEVDVAASEILAAQP